MPRKSGRYEDSKLNPDTPLRGNFVADETNADVEGVLLNIQDVLAEEEMRAARQREAEE